MNNEITQAINAHAVADFPKESCGVVCVVKGRERYIPCRNNATNPNDHFVMDPNDYADAEDLGEVMAIVHSHPNVSARATEADRVGCEASGVTWHIVSVSAPDDAETPIVTEMRSISPSGYEAPLVGREFFHGTLDCYTLIRDWFKRERNIDLPQFERLDDWWNDGESALYMDNFEFAGCRPIKGGMKPGDIILMQIRSKNDTPNHAGIYLGDDVMLHHLYGRLSSRDIYGGYFADITRLVVRHKELWNE